MINRLFFPLFLAVAGSAQAGTGDLAFVFNDSGQIMSVVRGALPGTFSTSLELGSVTAASTAGNFVATGTATIAGPAGALPVAVARTVSGLAVAGAIGAQVAKGVAPVAMGLAAYELFQAYRVRKGSSGLEIDPGADPVTTTKTMYGLVDFPTIPLAASRSAICTSWKDYIKSQGGTSASSSEYDSVMTYSQGDGPETCVTIKTIVSTPKLPWLSPVTNTSTYQRSIYINNSAPVTGCPDALDALTGQSYTPGVGADGKCLTGRYEPITLANAAARVAQGMTVEAVKAYIAKGPLVDPVPSVGNPTITGPASQNGTPATTTTTSTAPNGTVTTINNTTTPVYSYTYGGNTISIDNSVKTTTTTNVGGNVTTTETKADTPTDQQCKDFPNSLACLQLGELQDEEVPEEEREVDISPEDVDLPSGCPADVALPGGRTLSYASACAAAEDVAPLVIAAGVLSALLIAVAAIRGS